MNTFLIILCILLFIPVIVMFLSLAEDTSTHYIDSFDSFVYKESSKCISYSEYIENSLNNKIETPEPEYKDYRDIEIEECLKLCLLIESKQN